MSTVNRSPSADSRVGRYAPWLLLSVAAVTVLAVMSPHLIVQSNTPTGGDMGAHVLIPAALRDSLLPSGRIFGWSNSWYAGFPLLYFYFPLPALVIVGLDLFIPYGVAFKLVTVAGLVGLPFAAYYFVRSMGLSRPVAVVGGIAGGTFLFMESFTIFGANILSTLAGEYSFSWSFALSLIYLGMLMRNVRAGKGFTAGPAVMLALTALSHLITTMLAVAASLPLLLRKRGGSSVVGSWFAGFLLTAFWAVPLVRGVFSGLTTDMGWDPVRGIDNVLKPELYALLPLAAIGLFWAVSRQAVVAPAVMMMVVPVSAYYIIQWVDFTVLYNARLLPYWYFTVYTLAGVALGLGAVTLARRIASVNWNERTLWGLTAAASIIFLVAPLLMAWRPAGWSSWNYSGYEGKEGWPEYQGYLQAIDELPPGRVMWENNNDQGRYGTPMALMLTPYFSEDHPSMEGLLFESSISTPFHFLTTAEVSSRSSNPVRGLVYNNLQFDRGLEHLKLFNVEYYVAFTDPAKEEADKAGLEVLARPEPWVIYEVPDSSLVDIATYQPVVYGGEQEFKDVAIEWFDSIETLDRWMVAEGPEEWRRVEEFDPGARRTPISSTGVVSDIKLEDHRISFRTTAIGVPHLIKVSYFPNWAATGAEGPYYAAPSFMVVVPTAEEVVLDFERTWAEWMGLALSAGGLILLFGLRRRMRSTFAPKLHA